MREEFDSDCLESAPNTPNPRDIQIKNEKPLVKDCLDVLETSLDSWLEGNPVNYNVSCSWSAALEAAKNGEMECLSKFLSPFDAFFSMLARDGAPLPALALLLGKGAIFVANRLLTALNDKDAASRNLGDMLETLKDAFELKSQLELLSAEYLAGRKKQPIHPRHNLVSPERHRPEFPGQKGLEKLRVRDHMIVLPSQIYSRLSELEETPVME